MQKTCNIAAVALLALLLLRSTLVDVAPPVKPIEPAKADFAAVVQETDGYSLPAYVDGAMQKLRKEGYQAPILDDDVKTGRGKESMHVKHAIAVATAHGLPALVVMGGGKIISVQSLPPSMEAILEAVR